MNELQIRLTADIQGLQSAINKAKQTLKSFESETATDSEKSNVGFRRKIGLIEQLTAKAKQLKVSLAQATNEQDIAAFNAQLEITNTELTRLNALGKTFSAPAVRSFENLKSSAGAATGSAIAFSRIIQDAPFGIIGVANNLQSFGEQFAALGGKATTAGQKLSMFFSALITPANLAILAVSALTAAWQAYSLGVFDSLFKTESLNDRLKDLNESTKSATANAGVELIKLENLRSVIENETLSRDKRLRAVNELIDTYPKLFSLADKEKLLNGDLITSYDILTKAIIAKAKASIGEQELPNLIKQKEIVDSQLQLRKQQLATEEALLKNSSQLTKISETFTGSEYEQVARRIKPLKSDVEELTLKQKELQISIDGYTQSVVSYANEYQSFLDGNTKSTQENNKEFDLQASLLDRFNQKIDLSKFLTEGLAQEQKRLFESITRLKQAGDVGFNPTLLAIYEEKLAEIDKIIGSIASKRTETNVPVPSETEAEITTGTEPTGIIEGLQQKISDLERLREVTSDPTQLAKYNEQIGALRTKLQELTNTKDQTTETINAIVDAFSSLGAGIAASLNIGDRALRGFVTTLLSQTPKIIAALSKQADSNLSNAGKNIAADKAESISSGIKQGTKFAEALGPVGLALLPVLIAGAVAVISSAFGKVSGGGSVSAGTGTTFTNRREFGGPVSKGRAYIVGERRPELFVPNTNGIIIPQLPSMDYSGARVNSSMYGVEVMLKGPDDLLFFVEQAQIRRGLR